MTEHSDDDDDVEKSLKFVILGDSCSGKTALCLKFTQNVFQSKYTQTAGVDFYSKRVSLCNNTTVFLQLWDVGGHNIASPTMLKTYVYEAHSVLFVYDVTNTQSFENICDWILIVKKIASQVEKPFNMCLIGSKTDMEHQRVISIEKNNKGAKKYNLDPFYVSAKTGDNVEFMFKTISAKILGVKLSRADQDWNISVIKAPILHDNIGNNGQLHLNEKKKKSSSNQNETLDQMNKQKALEETPKKVLLPNTSTLQPKIKTQNKNSAVCLLN